MLKPFISRKLPSLREPPIEPSQMLWVTQQAVEHHITQRVVKPRVRNNAQVLTVVPQIGSISIQW